MATRRSKGMTGFRVCVIVPPGYVHAACFSETALLLRHSLLSMGFECDLALNELARNRVNIILGVNLLSPETQFGDIPVVLYQLEQLSETEGWFSAKSEAILSQAIAVWDYSPDNISFLRRKGISATYVPLGYHSALKAIPENPVKDIDVLFFGSMNSRRSMVLEYLKKRGYAVEVIFGVYGRKRDEYISRSRIVLNIHYYEANIFEAVRVSYLLNNEVFVVSEHSQFYPWKKVPLQLVSYEKLTEACEYWLNEEGARDVLRRDMSLAFRSFYPMIEILSGAIKCFPVDMFKGNPMSLCGLNIS
jgi:hypothetical protein